MNNIYKTPAPPAMKARWLAVAGLSVVLLAVVIIMPGCFGKNALYKFKDIAIPDTINTVKVNFFENRAPYINPQLSPRLTDAVRQKIISQTKLKQTNNDNADWVLDATITNYAVSTAGVSQGQAAQNRLTVTIHIVRLDQKGNKTVEYDISRNFDFSATQSITEAENAKFPEMIKGLTDDIFNRIFSDW